jgi:hypothetical protein
VILAVSLGLMALLVATAGGTPASRTRGQSNQAAARMPDRPQVRAAGGRDGSSPTPTTTTTTTVASTTTTSAATSGAGQIASSLVTARSPAASNPPAAAAPVATTTTLPSTTTTAQPAVPADRTQTQGILNPPVQTSGRYGFTGTGAMQVSVVWSGDTYLTLDVDCPNGDQSAGGTSAMAASIPDATGSCVATVSEPATESTALTYTIAISPTGG